MDSERHFVESVEEIDKLKPLIYTEMINVMKEASELNLYLEIIEQKTYLIRK